MPLATALPEGWYGGCIVLTAYELPLLSTGVRLPSFVGLPSSPAPAYEVGAPAITELAAGMSVGLPSAFVLTLAMLLTAGDAFAFG